MSSFLQVMRDRGFVQQSTDDDTGDRPLEKVLGEKRLTAYIGYDPTASSLHAGSLVTVMGLKHFQLCGHRPIALVGGGTGMVGDPSGKTELRQMLTQAEVQANLESQKRQLGRYLDLAPEADPSEERGMVLNNAEWLLDLNYIEFLRDIGRHFSVNRMLAAESVQQRLSSDAGLSFIEFNYSILQAYDFLFLKEKYDCELQMGGGDQWGNIVAGVDLIRRVRGERAHGITFPLMTTADGRKMGKTEKGAVWLDPERTSPYEFYQYWINRDDRDVGRLLRIFTLVPLKEIRALEELRGADIRRAKEVLAFEVTRLSHGEEEACKAQDAARELFGSRESKGAGAPSYRIELRALEEGILALELCADSGLCESRNAARRLARQNGLYVNGKAVSEDRAVTPDDMQDGAILLRAGKKRYMRVVAE